jgi:hypothetical protein
MLGSVGYIVIPLIVPAKMDFEAFAETTPFRQVAQTITALSTQEVCRFRTCVAQSIKGVLLFPKTICRANASME